MQAQNYTNHRRYVPLYHGLNYILILLLGIASFVNLVDAFSEPDEILNAVSLVGIFMILILVSWYARVFALKAQDRAIRAEENLRHFVLTGKLFDAKLRMGQVVALRFAPDEELVELARKAAAENMKPDEIKRAIKNWKGDYQRA
jgi:hypothetical protein